MVCCFDIDSAGLRLASENGDGYAGWVTLVAVGMLVPIAVRRRWCVAVMVVKLLPWLLQLRS